MLREYHPPVPAADAERIELARRELLLKSEAIRQGKLRFMRRRALRILAREAFVLVDSQAPGFEKLAALNETQANLGASDLSSNPHLRTIASLSARLLAEEFPEPQISQAQEAELKARKWAIEHTNRKTAFPQAIEEGWQKFSMPMDLLIEVTDEYVKKAERVARHEQNETAEQATGSFEFVDN